MKSKFVGTFSLLGAIIVASLLAVSSNAKQQDERINLRQSLTDMGYEDIAISECWISFTRTLEPTEKNGWTEHYILYFNIGYFKEFSQREIQVIGNGENIFYGFETRLDKTYPLRPLTFQGFKRWVENKYPGANWPNVHKSKQRTNIPAIETALAKRIPILAHLNRWVSSTRFGKITNVSEFFQMTWKEREPLENFLHALESYAERSDCDIEN